MHLPDITLALFSLFNVLRVGSYLPQIARVASDGEGARTDMVLVDRRQWLDRRLRRDQHHGLGSVRDERDQCARVHGGRTAYHVETTCICPKDR